MRGPLTLASVMAFVALTSAAAQDAPPAVPAITTLSPPPAASTAPASTPLVSTPPPSPPSLSGDASAVPGSIVWGLASLLAVAGTIVAYRRWPHTGTIYLLSTPILLATAVLWFEHLAQLLPASF